MIQDETIDVEVALLQEREQQIRQLEVQTYRYCAFCVFYYHCSHYAILCTKAALGILVMLSN